MKKFTKENAIISGIVNIPINGLITYVVLLKDNFVNSEGETPNLFSILLPAVFFSIMMTTVITFFLLTKKRKSREINLAINPQVQWFLPSLKSGVIIGLAFVVAVILWIIILQIFTENFTISKNNAVLLAAVVGCVVAFLSSFLATKEAAKIQ